MCFLLHCVIITLLNLIWLILLFLLLFLLHLIVIMSVFALIYFGHPPPFGTGIKIYVSKKSSLTIG